jgi:MFS-type transporter involved in bile tolerance (Atg22 family)
MIAITGSVQSGILSVLLFFVVGMAILWTVNEKKGMEEKLNPVLLIPPQEDDHRA